MPTHKPFDGEKLVTLIASYYKLPGNVAGGNLHIILDDGNCDAGSIHFCAERCSTKADLMGLQILEQLEVITEEHREALYNRRWEENITAEEIRAQREDELEEREEDESD